MDIVFAGNKWPVMDDMHDELFQSVTSHDQTVDDQGDLNHHFQVSNQHVPNCSNHG